MRETEIPLDPLTMFGGVVMLTEVEKEDSLRRSISMALFTVCLVPSGWGEGKGKLHMYREIRKLDESYCGVQI